MPIDGSKNSLEAADYAIMMAEKYGSEVALVHVVNLDQTLQLLGIYEKILGASGSGPSPADHGGLPD